MKYISISNGEEEEISSKISGNSLLSANLVDPILLVDPVTLLLLMGFALFEDKLQ